jgi:hypothetical protein
MTGPILLAVPLLFVWAVALVVVAHRVWNACRASERFVRQAGKLEDALTKMGGGR